MNNHIYEITRAKQLAIQQSQLPFTIITPNKIYKQHIKTQKPSINVFEKCLVFVVIVVVLLICSINV